MTVSIGFLNFGLEEKRHALLPEVRCGVLESKTCFMAALISRCA